MVVYNFYQLYIWCTKESEVENKISSNKMKSSLSQPSLRNLFSQKFTTTERKEFKKWCLHLNTQKSKSHPTLSQLFERLAFFGKFSFYSWESIPSEVSQKWEKAEKSLFIQLLKQKKWMKNFYTKHYSPAVMNTHTPKQRSSGDFAFKFPILFESGN